MLTYQIKYEVYKFVPINRIIKTKFTYSRKYEDDLSLPIDIIRNPKKFYECPKYEADEIY